MKKFIVKLLFFSIVALSISIGLVIATNSIINNKKLFGIANCPENIVVGHSQTEETFDDEIIKNTKNLSMSGENIYYTYFKVYQILKCNKTIKNIFISFTNHQITQNYDETSIWDEKHIDHSYSKYAAFMSINDYLVLLKNNPLGIIKAQPLATKKQLMFLLKNKKSIYEDYLIGNFVKLKTSRLDSILNFKKTNIKLDSINFKYSKYTFIYLDKIIDLCKNKNVELFLIRTPVHKTWNELNDEYFFQKILKEKYSQIDFLDFKKFPLMNNEYYDQSHLNQFGAAKFSTFFNKLLEKGLLQKGNKQEFINQEIDIIF
jgi:hypothetical protein